MSKGPGKWQRAILAALETEHAIPVARHFSTEMGRPLTRAEYTAVQRAAGTLQRSRVAIIHDIWVTNYLNHRAIEKWIFRPGLVPADLNLPRAKSRTRWASAGMKDWRKDGAEMPERGAADK